MATTDRSLVEELYDVTADVEVVVSLDRGERVVGRPSRIERDEAGVRVELCPYDGDAPQYRIRADRTPSGWRTPRVERRPMTDEWTRYGRLVGLDCVDAPPVR